MREEVAADLRVCRWGFIRLCADLVDCLLDLGREALHVRLPGQLHHGVRVLEQRRLGGRFSERDGRLGARRPQAIGRRRFESSEEGPLARLIVLRRVGEEFEEGGSREFAFIPFLEYGIEIGYG